MARNVQHINIAFRRGGPEEPRPFSDFTASRNVVLLGDPGSGKSHLFRETAAAEGARFVTARAFLVTPTQRLKGQALYIDALDERRAGRGDRDTIDTIVQKLFEVEPTKVRISCRVADWLGETDLAALNPFFEIGGTPAVLLLERLSTEEQRAVLVAQGLTPNEADAFLAQARERGLTEFLDNPQNLLMLFRAVQGGTWPATRYELFNTATSLMLKETDPSHARAGVGVFAAEELAPVAGAIFAARLISDVQAISLADQEGSPDIPGYRSVTLYDPSRVQAALGRRVFVAASESETVDYAHRTTAEFLAAKWLADRVRAGLPLGRLMALIGVDGVPAPELRGLHAWLPVHLSEHAEQLIDADPYGVLSYGDASTMSKSVCAYLLKALAGLSQKNPWFRSGAWQSPSIGALARQDMEEQFRTILNSPDAGFGIRSLVVDALAMGKPLPSMIGDLAAVLVREASTYAERSHALTALLRLGDAGKAVIVDACNNGLAGTTNSLRLSALGIEQLYGEPFGSDDVIALVNNSLDVEDRSSTGLLWGLSNAVPLADLPIILDGIKALSQEDDVERRNAWEVASFYTRSLIRVWKSDLPFEPARGLGWLRTRHSYAGTYSGATDELRGAIASTPDRLQRIVEGFLQGVKADENGWHNWHELRELTFFQLDVKDLLARVLKQLAAELAGTQKEVFLYEVAFSLVYAAVPNSEQEFELLYDLPSSLPHLLSTRDASITATLPKDYYVWKLRRKEKEETYDPEAQRAAFSSDAEAIRNAINFYIRPPRFAQVIRKRLELVMENLQTEVDPQQEYTLATGLKIKYPATRLGEFLLGIYLSMFDDRSVKVASALEALVAKDVRRALGMFGDIIVSPHIPTVQITGSVLSGGDMRIRENAIIRSLMRGRQKYYNGRSLYIHNILLADPGHNRPSNLLIPDILEYLIRNRKAKIDFTQEGYATIGTVVKKMSRLGYDEEDAFKTISTLVKWGLIEPESLVVETLATDDAIRMHASGFIHMRFFLERSEYLIGITTNLQFASREVAEGIGRLWASQGHRQDPTLPTKQKIMKFLADDMRFEYARRCKRHAFYEEHGLGGKSAIESIEKALAHLDFAVTPKPPAKKLSTPRTHRAPIKTK